MSFFQFYVYAYILGSIKFPTFLRLVEIKFLDIVFGMNEDLFFSTLRACRFLTKSLLWLFYGFSNCALHCSIRIAEGKCFLISRK